VYNRQQGHCRIYTQFPILDNFGSHIFLAVRSSFAIAKVVTNMPKKPNRHNKAKEKRRGKIHC